MDFLTLKTRAAKELNLVDSSGVILTSKNITETKLGQSINDAYIEHVYPILQSQYPNDFLQEDYLPNYSVTGTVSASSTSTTLVASSAIFAESMIGLRVYNDTDDEYATITSYTNTTTVTLDTSIGDTWDGDDIKVLQRDYVLGDGTYSASAIKSLFVRYTSTDPYIRAVPRFYNDVFQVGTEEFHTSTPIYTWGTIDVSSVPKRGFSIYPLFSVPDTRAIRITYLEKPPLLSATTDEPYLPLGHHAFLFWAAVKEGAVIDGNAQLAAMAEGEYQKGLSNLLSNYLPTSADTNVEIRLPRRLEAFASRRI